MTTSVCLSLSLYLQVQQLDRQKHSSLVKLNGECLQVRNELRGLKNERHQLSRRQGSSMSADGAESLPHNSLSSTSSSATGTKGVRKSPSIGSLASLSSGYSSLSSSSSVGRRSSGADTEGVGSRGKGPGLGLGPVLKGWNADVTALRLKNFHSARALSKLNNDMDIIH